MQCLFAFEQLIINTEDPNEQTNQDLHFIDGYNEVEEFKKALDEEEDPYLKEQLQMLYNPLYKGMIDPE